MDSIGSRIKNLRKEYKLTQQELGDIVGLHGTNIGRIENGSVLPDAGVIFKISTHFNVSCDFLISGKEELSIPINNIEEYPDGTCATDDDTDETEKLASPNNILNATNKKEELLIQAYRILSEHDKNELYNFLLRKVTDIVAKSY